MKDRTRILIRIDSTNGAQIVDGNSAVQFKILPDNSAQIDVSKRYAIYLTKVGVYGVASATAVNNKGLVMIDGLSVMTNNIVVNSNNQNLPVIGYFTLQKTNEDLGQTLVIWENAHPRDDALICSNPFNRNLKLKIINLTDLAFYDLSASKLVIEIMIEELCDC